MQSENGNIKKQIITALCHPEASDGLYFRNFHHLHEEDERDPVEGSDVQILEALKELITEGAVTTEDSGKELVFHLAGSSSSSEHI